MFAALHNLPDATLCALATSLRQGPLARGLSRLTLEQVTGTHAIAVQTTLERLAREQGLGPSQMALLIDAMVETRRLSAESRPSVDLVLSGPEVLGVPTADTAATLQMLIEGALEEVLLVGYTVHNGRRLFRRLAERLDSMPMLQVTFCLDIARKATDTSLTEEIVRRFGVEFVNKHWPGKRLPALLYDPRALAARWEERASLHAKCVIVDRVVAMVTSANFTDAAQRKNIEVGVLLRQPALVARLHDYFTGLRNSGELRACPLPSCRPNPEQEVHP